MSYEKTNWQDRIVEKPLTYNVQNNPDGTVTLVPSPGIVTQEGTFTNAARMNRIENELVDQNYQIPVVVGSQIQLIKNGATGRLFFYLDADINGSITISLDGGATSVPLKDYDNQQIGGLDKGYVEVVDNTSFFTYAPKGGGIDTIIKNYVVSADGNINAGDLCEFINGQVRKTFQTRIDNPGPVTVATTAATAVNYTAVQIDETRTALFYVQTQVWGVVIKVTNGAIIKSDPVQLCAAGSYLLATKMSSTKLLLRGYNLTGGGTYDTVLITVSDMVLNKVSGASIVPLLGAGSGNNIPITRIDDNHAMFYYVNTSSSSTLYCNLLTINGDVLSMGADILLSTQVSDVYVGRFDRFRQLVFFRGSLAGYTKTLGMLLYVDEQYVITKGFYDAITSQASVPIYPIILENNKMLLLMLTTRIFYIVLEIDTNTNTFRVFKNSYITGSDYIGTITSLSTPAACRVKDKVIVFFADSNASYKLNRATLAINEDYTLSFKSSSIIYNNTGYPMPVSKINDYTVMIPFDVGATKQALVVEVDNFGVVNSNFVLLHKKNPQVIALSGGSPSQSIRCSYPSLVKGLSGLTVGAKYYCDDSGNLTTTKTDCEIGKALSDTNLIFKER